MDRQRGQEMKIVKIKGGLGNQLFQYAFGRMMSIDRKFEVKYDLHQYKTTFNEINTLKLDKFNTILPVASNNEIKRYCKVPLKGNPHTKSYRIKIILNKILSPKSYFFEKRRLYVSIDKLLKYSYYDGYWQCEKYFNSIRSDLLKEISLKDPSPNTISTIKKIKEQNAVFVGIRRPYSFESFRMKRTLTDISSNIEYYQKAIEYINKRINSPVFYVFSNDIEWVMKNINFSSEVIYRTKEMQASDEEELMIMASCKHGILSNSTFNWWGAWLIQNPDKIIIVPEHWQRKKNDIIPSSWISYDKLMKG